MINKKLVLGVLDTNCYILSGNGKTAVVIDPAESYDIIKKTLSGMGLTAEAVLVTHGHLDHTNAARRMQEAGVKVYMNFADKKIIGDDFGFGYPVPVEKFVPDIKLEDGAILSVAGLLIKVLFTPGHSAGSTSFLIEDSLFSGDTLFRRHVGRTDLRGGDENTLIRSIKKLYKLPPETPVFPGHGKETTIEFEMTNNYDIRND